MTLAELKQLFVFDNPSQTYKNVLSKILELESAKDSDWIDAPPLTLNDLIETTERIHKQPRHISNTDDNNF